jgi:Protein of unknown function (DUF433)
MGMSPDEIIYHHPTITLADVYAAFAYYHDNREEIRRQIEAGEAFAKQLQGNKPSLIEKIMNYPAASGRVRLVRQKPSKSEDWRQGATRTQVLST